MVKVGPDNLVPASGSRLTPSEKYKVSAMLPK